MSVEFIRSMIYLGAFVLLMTSAFWGTVIYGKGIITDDLPWVLTRPSKYYFIISAIALVFLYAAPYFGFLK